MATNLALDNKLLEEALRVGGKATKKDTVTEALQEYIGRRKQARSLAGGSARSVRDDAGATAKQNPLMAAGAALRMVTKS